MDKYKLKFDTELDKAIKEAVANEPKSNIPTTRSTTHQQVTQKYPEMEHIM